NHPHRKQLGRLSRTAFAAVERGLTRQQQRAALVLVQRRVPQLTVDRVEKALTHKRALVTRQDGYEVVVTASLIHASEQALDVRIGRVGGRQLRQDGDLEGRWHQQRSEQQGHSHRDTLQLFSSSGRRKPTSGRRNYRGPAVK